MLSISDSGSPKKKDSGNAAYMGSSLFIGLLVWGMGEAVGSIVVITIFFLYFLFIFGRFCWRIMPRFAMELSA